MNGSVYFLVHESPLGELLLTSDGEALTGLHMIETGHAPQRDSGWVRDPGPFRSMEMPAQLDGYFAGAVTSFDLPVRPRGTPFQQEVWEALGGIPYGETVSYGEIARRVGRPRAVRAVGAANRRNPVAIVIPCHRVIGADGSLTGYGGGLRRKEFLVGLERTHRARDGGRRGAAPGGTGSDWMEGGVV